MHLIDAINLMSIFYVIQCPAVVAWFVNFSFSKFCTFCERWIESRLGMFIRVDYIAQGYHSLITKEYFDDVKKLEFHVIESALLQALW